MIDANDVPNWVPAAVKAVAPAIGIGPEDIKRRLLIDPKMEGVWRTLKTQAKKQVAENAEKFAGRLDALDSLWRMQTWDVSDLDVSLEEQACAAFFLIILVELGVPKSAVKDHDIRKEIERWRFAAGMCREALEVPHKGRLDRDLARALTTSAGYFEEWAKFIGTASKNSPHVIGRAGQNRAPGGEKDKSGDDAIRGHVRAIAIATRDIFGSFLCGTVAKAASVALDRPTEKPITGKSVENWCAEVAPVSR
jgi:hypothetical protein